MIKIGNKEIRNGAEPFIIAEAGINHNGELEQALAMIKTAKESGADAVKFQTFKAEEFVADVKQTYTYTSQGKEVTESMQQMFKRYEFSRDDWLLIKKKCDELGITFLSTPQNYSDLELLLEIGIPAIKVGSDDFVNLPLLKSYAATGLPLILSCGMADGAEVQKTLASVGFATGYPLVLLLCTSEYPTKPDNVNILRLNTLSHDYPGLILGFSDHSLGNTASVMAVALGAVVFEKHFTLDQDQAGPDHWFSSGPAELTKWVNKIKEAYLMLGSAQIKPTKKEEAMRVLARRSIFAIADIGVGEKFTAKNIGLLRPGNGLPAHLFNEVIGSISKRPIKKGEMIMRGDY